MEPGPSEKTASVANRRGFFRALANLTSRTALAGGALAGLLGLRRGRTASAGERGALGILRPPGSAGEPDFLARCIRCTRCADVCETGCIGCRLCVKKCPFDAITVTDNVALIDYGKCQNCGICASACPTGCILDTLAPRQEAFITDACVGCGLCVKECPVTAITGEKKERHTVDAAACVGCKLCFVKCPVQAIELQEPAAAPAASGIEENAKEEQ